MAEPSGVGLVKREHARGFESNRDLELCAMSVMEHTGGCFLLLEAAHSIGIGSTLGGKCFHGNFAMSFAI